MLANPRAGLPLAGRFGRPRPPAARRAGPSEAPAGLCPTGRLGLCRSWFNRGASASWSQTTPYGTPEGRSGAPVRRAIPATWDFPEREGRGGRKGGPRACHRARFVTNFRSTPPAPAEPLRRGPCQRWSNRELVAPGRGPLAFRLQPSTPSAQRPAQRTGRSHTMQQRAPYRPSAFLRADTRRRDTGIFSSTPLSVSSSVPPDTDSISSTMDRFTR